MKKLKTFDEKQWQQMKLDEYMRRFGDAYNAGELWDFSKEDVESGAIELDPDMIYWEIGDRYYETGLPRMSFEAPVEKDKNRFKNVYIGRIYRACKVAQELEIYQMELLGLVPANSCWGSAEVLRCLFDEYKLAIARKHKPRKFSGVTFVPSNDSHLFILKADSMASATSKFIQALSELDQDYKLNYLARSIE